MKNKFTTELRDENKVPFGTVEIVLTSAEFEKKGVDIVKAAGAAYGKVWINGNCYYVIYANI